MALRESVRLCKLSISEVSRQKLCIRWLSLCSTQQNKEGVSVASSPQTSTIGNAGSKKAEKISQAMKIYLEKTKAHEEFMEREVAEFEIGKRHLAHIMSIDPDTISQEDIDTAIEYLLPSGLHNKKARPLMKHPTEVIPQKKVAQFGIDGRPFHSMYYTCYPEFYQKLHDIAVKYEALQVHANNMLSQGIQPKKEDRLNLAGSQWLEKHVLEGQLNEKLTDIQFEKFVKLTERLAAHEYASLEKEFVMSFRRDLVSKSLIGEIPPLQYDEAGRAFAEGEGIRKKAFAKVKIWDKGSGEVTINGGKDLLDHFPLIADREQVMFPLQFTNRLGEVDFEATVEGGGHSGQSGAIRLALSRALRSFVSKEVVEKMRLAGLLTEDPRQVERQKPGQAGARRKYTWKKR